MLGKKKRVRVMHEITLTFSAPSAVSNLNVPEGEKPEEYSLYFEVFSTEERLKMMLRWDAKCRSYFVHDP